MPFSIDAFVVVVILMFAFVLPYHDAEFVHIVLDDQDTEAKEEGRGYQC